MRRAKGLVAGAALIGTGFVASTAAHGARGQDDSVLPALLVEVRGLRAAIEQMASAGPRVQLALGRLQLQEPRLTTMIRRLESVRDSRAGAERDTTELQGHITRVQDSLKSGEASTDQEVVERARQLRYEQAELNRRFAVAQQELQRWQTEEAQLQQRITGEQGRWTEINRSLEDLERALQKR